MNLAIIVPYRDREKHLAQFVPYLKRKVEADIYIIEQADYAIDEAKEFNRAKLLNIGFLEEWEYYDYFAFHDIDMLPVKANYSFPENPTLLATHVQQFSYQMPFPEYFGGVVLFNKEDFWSIGGYSNNFWGWGGEDNEMYNRLRDLDMPITYRKGYFQSLPHPRPYQGLFDPQKLEQSKIPRKDDDGLLHCGYRVVSKKTFPLYTKISVEI